jgi:hypothetical protein
VMAVKSSEKRSPSLLSLYLIFQIHILRFLSYW